MKTIQVARVCITLVVIVLLMLGCRRLERRVGETGWHVISLLERIVYKDEYDSIARLLKIYEAKIDGVPLKLVRLGKDNDGGYVVPTIALEKSDVLMGYGIADDISFEQQYSQQYDRHSYGFDGGVANIRTGHSKCHFYSECLGNDSHLYKGQVSSRKFASYSEHLKKLGLEKKKIFLKMDIEGAEFDVFDDILRHQENISGFVLELHMNNNPVEVKKLLSSIDKSFLLVHVHGNTCCKSEKWTFISKYSTRPIPSILELTYVNRDLITSYKVARNQKHPTELDQPNSTEESECKFEILVDTNEE